MSHTIDSLEQLAELYPEPHPLAVQKAIDHIDPHTKTFIEHSPLCIIASRDSEGFLDTSPRGGVPGFVKVLDEHTIAFPDSAGNNRIDTLKNLVNDPHIGLIFLIPGIKEVVRVKGTATLTTDEELKNTCLDGNKPGKLVVKIHVHKTYFHCPKALLLAKIWEADAQIERDFLPNMLQIIKDQLHLNDE
ncbi:MSMEG_1061 family FMN-dependent PPOX-type flavoprotein [Vibrio tritonius]|uniref:MSMEG_1061 family FMN-dependent PPOX-type flavoprotein n=1 Tax=Vibrio tritonius TaxID=1435069 RepID=UPI000837FC22|nr:MSMEG_1061 family FMN-dependent PPOX-type flavoprotein [Vibrio tritonius]